VSTIYVGPNAFERFIEVAYALAYQHNTMECDALADDPTAFAELRYAPTPLGDLTMTRRDEIIKEALKEVYLGDGLYCKFDGYQFVLRAPREDGDHHVALEPDTLSAFETHVKLIRNLHSDLNALDEAVEIGEPHDVRL
jgi:hypothetical protein